METIIAEFKPDWAKRAIDTHKTGVPAPEGVTCVRCGKEIKPGSRAAMVGYQEAYMHWSCNISNLKALLRANR